MIFFLSTNTFPKNCDIQDSYISLCEDALAEDNTCTMDSSNQYAAYSSSEYPSSICEVHAGLLYPEVL